MPRTGRPTKLNQPITLRNNQPVTAREAILERLRAGAFREEAARSIGISSPTFHGWILRGARARARDTQHLPVEPRERTYIEFLNEVEAAEAESQLTLWFLHGTVANGGIRQEVITVKVDGDGHTIEQSTKTTHTLPDARAIEWRLKQRWPARYRESFEVVDGLASQIAEAEDDAGMDRLMAELAAYDRGRKDAEQQAERPG